MVIHKTVFGIPRKSLMLGLVILLVIIIGGAARFFIVETEEDSMSDHPPFTAQRGPLTISVSISGTIKAREQIILKSEIEGRTSILYLIPEGTRVKDGERLVELDASQLLDAKIDQQIKVQNADAAFVNARENLAVVKNQAQSDIEKAQLTYDFAIEDLKKYREGEYPNQLKEAESLITLAVEELTRAKEKVEWSTKLFKEKYISQSELQADELAAKRKALDLELAQNNRNLLKDFTHKRRMAQLESDVKQAKMALERTIRKAKADVAQAEATLGAREAEFGQQKDKLEKTEKQIEKAIINAPSDGLVIYASSAQRGGFRGRSTEPLQEGQEVRERQELIYLPTTTASKVEVAIHEASLDKVHVGLPVIVTVDAIPGEVFTGKVAKIAPLPDAQSAFLNPDLKVYNTDIYLENNSRALRTGMSCKAEIIVEQHKEAVYVPVQAVLRVKGEPTVYVIIGKKLEPRKVAIGLDNNRMVHIISGLEPGEVVSLTPPLIAATVEQDSEKIMQTISESSNPPPASQSENGSASPDIAAETGKAGPERRAPGDPSQPSTRTERQVSPDRQTVSPEQRDRMRTLFQSLPSEERERIQNLPPEERRRAIQQKLREMPQSGGNDS